MFDFINILGGGFVGGSIAHLCKSSNVKFCSLDIQDKSGNGEERFFYDIKELVKHSETSNYTNIYYICVPTNSDKDGNCDTSLVEGLVKSLFEISNKKTCIIIKSTLVPGTCSKLNKKYFKDNFGIYFSPEFLRQKTALQDILNQDYVIIGSESGKKNYVYDIINKIYNKEDDIIFTSYEEAELMKYTINTYLATKVYFFNEIYQVCDKLDVNYNNLRNLFLLDHRIGESHTKVPGDDGKFGYGLLCLPKESRGMIQLRKSLNLNTSVLQNVIEQNENIRNE